MLPHTVLRSATSQTCGHGDHMRARIICLHTFLAHSSGKSTQHSNASADPYCHGSITLVCPVSMSSRDLLMAGRSRAVEYRHIGGEGTEETRRSEQMCAWADRQASSDPLAHSVVRVASASSDSDLGTHSSNSGTDAQSCVQPTGMQSTRLVSHTFAH